MGGRGNEQVHDAGARLPSDRHDSGGQLRVAVDHGIEDPWQEQ